MTQHERWLVLVGMWLDKADGDLRAARACAGDAIVPGWITGFHLQQATEKALKGLLVLGQREAPRTHDLARLVALLTEAGGASPIADDAIASLQPFAVDERYPMLVAPEVDRTRLAALLDPVQALLDAARAELERRRKPDAGGGPDEPPAP